MKRIVALVMAAAIAIGGALAPSDDADAAPIAAYGMMYLGAPLRNADLELQQFCNHDRARFAAAHQGMVRIDSGPHAGGIESSGFVGYVCAYQLTTVIDQAFETLGAIAAGVNPNGGRLGAGADFYSGTKVNYRDVVDLTRLCQWKYGPNAVGHAADATTFQGLGCFEHHFAPLLPYTGTIVTQASSGTSWLVGRDGKRRWIPTTDVYHCLTRRGVRTASVSNQVLDQYPDQWGVHATCDPVVAQPPMSLRWSTPEPLRSVFVTAAGATAAELAVPLTINFEPLPYLSPIPDSSQPPYGDGTFIEYSGRVYVIAGGAPVWVSSWANVGGSKPVRAVSASTFSKFRSKVADGTFIRAHTGRVYVIAGGAPVWVSSWANVGGQKPTVAIDGWAVDHAGHERSGLNDTVADGTLVRTHLGHVYTIAGGAPVWVSDWANVGGSKPTVAIDGWAVDNAGHERSSMHARVLDGTFVRAHTTGRVYVVAGGAPVWVSDWSHVGGSRPTVAVDGWTIDNAGHQRSSLNDIVADGTLVRSENGRVYVIAGGAPVWVSDWANIGGPQPTVGIDSWAVSNAGHARSAFRTDPIDGVCARALPAGVTLSVSGGTWVPAACDPTVTVDSDVVS